MSQVIDIPLFPLPGVVLFPGCILPLRVFEPRYLKLLQDVMAAEKLIGMANLIQNKELLATEPPLSPPVYDVLGIGQVVACQQLDDGTYHIALLGLSRNKLIDELPHTPYRIGRTLKLEEKKPETLDAQQNLLALHKDMLEKSTALVKRTLEAEAAAQFHAALKERAEPGQSADLLASIFISDPQLRQTLLENLDVASRVQIVQLVLSKLLQKLEGRGPHFGEGNVCLN